MKRIFAQRRPSWWINLRVTLATILLCLLGLEVAGRLFSPGASIWHHPNYIELATAPDPEQETQMRYDATLGHEPRPGFKGLLKGQPLTISPEGLRSHNAGRSLPAGAAAQPPILALGDSFTEGYMVGDDETWPAELERVTRRRVLNGGVRAYGIDQMVLRAERLAPQLRPAAIVMAFIPDDVDRTELAVRDNVHKPYFVRDGANGGVGLKLMNVPVPRTDTHGQLSLWRRVLGYSYLADFTMRHLGLVEVWYGANVRINDDGDEISCRLMDRLAGAMRPLNVPVLVTALPEPHDWGSWQSVSADRTRVDRLLACAKRAGLGTFDAWRALGSTDMARAPGSFYVNRHFTPAGNALVARLIAAELDRLSVENRGK